MVSIVTYKLFFLGSFLNQISHLSPVPIQSPTGVSIDILLYVSYLKATNVVCFIYFYIYSVYSSLWHLVGKVSINRYVNKWTCSNAVLSRYSTFYKPSQESGNTIYQYTCITTKNLRVILYSTFSFNLYI